MVRSVLSRCEKEEGGDLAPYTLSENSNLLPNAEIENAHPNERKQVAVAGMEIIDSRLGKAFPSELSCACVASAFLK
jgi:hypothetical protein